MNAALLTPPVRRWECPNCDRRDVTREAQPHSRFHACRGLAGLTVPMVPEGTKCKIEAVERGDWIGREHVRTDGNGRPIMSAVTTRDEGQDCTVYAPTATATGIE